jgi:TetR/AcrR family transcriptional repressor of nem operon
MLNRKQTSELPETKRKLVDAGVLLMRAKGFHATSLDEICSNAGVTKGGFFHYFKSKDEVAMAALSRFQEGRATAFAEAPFRALVDPLDRIFGRLDFVEESSGGTSGMTKGCLIGMLAQELSFTNAGLRNACQEMFLRMAQDVEHDLAEAKAVHAPKTDFDPKKLALFYVSLFQGSSMMAKSSASNSILVDNIEQFRAYLKSLFGLAAGKSATKAGLAADVQKKKE